MIAALSLFISLTFWLNYLALMRREPDTYPFRYVYSLGLHSKGLILSFVGLIHVVPALTKLGCETTRAHEVVNFYAACYFICMAICGLLKTFVGRERPCAAGSVAVGRLARVHRYFPDMQSFLRCIQLCFISVGRCYWWWGACPRVGYGIFTPLVSMGDVGALCNRENFLSRSPHA